MPAVNAHFFSTLPAFASRRIRKSAHFFGGQSLAGLTIISATALSSTTVQVVFSAAIDANQALINVGNYLVSPGLGLVSIAVNNSTTITITTAPQVQGTNYTLSAFRVDVSGAPALSGAFTGIGILPTLQTVLTLGSQTLRLTFSLAMANSGFTTGANYTLTPAGGSDPSIVVSAVRYSATQVTLTLSDALTPGTSNYTISVASLTAVDGNVIDPAHHTLTFDGPTPVVVSSSLDVNSDGGELVSFALDLDDGTYTVDILQEDPLPRVRAYSGISGQGTNCQSINGILTFVVPRLVPAEELTAELNGPGGIQTTDPLLNARRRPIFSATHQLRRSLPEGRWAVGPSSPAFEEIA